MGLDLKLHKSLGERNGFEIDPNRAEDMLANALPFAYGSEVKS